MWLPATAHIYMRTSATVRIDTSSCCRARNRWKHWWRDWGPANSDFWRLAQLRLSGGQRHGVPLLTECKETLTSTLVIFHPALMTQSKRHLQTSDFHGCVMLNWCLRYWHCLLGKTTAKKKYTLLLAKWEWHVAYLSVIAPNKCWVLIHFTCALGMQSMHLVKIDELWLLYRNKQSENKTGQTLWATVCKHNIQE